MLDTEDSWAACSSSIVIVASSAFSVTGASFVVRLCTTSSCLSLVTDVWADRRAGAIELIGLMNRNDDPFIRVYRARLCVYCDGTIRRYIGPKAHVYSNNCTLLPEVTGLRVLQYWAVAHLVSVLTNIPLDEYCLIRLSGVWRSTNKLYHNRMLKNWNARTSPDEHSWYIWDFRGCTDFTSYPRSRLHIVGDQVGTMLINPHQPPKYSHWTVASIIDDSIRMNCLHRVFQPVFHRVLHRVLHRVFIMLFTVSLWYLKKPHTYIYKLNSGVTGTTKHGHCRSFLLI